MMMSSPAVMAHPSSLWLALPGRMSTERTGEIAQRWMEMVLGEKFSQGFPKVLLSGEWLCALANKLFQAIGMRDRSCVFVKTSWPSAMSIDSATSMTAIAGSMEDALGDDRRSSERARDSSSGDMWLQQKRIARENVEEYLRACEVIGVPPQDIFEPDDLLELQNLDKVYRNLLSLQNVAMVISHRRSIDARSSASVSMRVVTSDATTPSFLTSRDSVMSIRSSSDATKDENVSWDRVLNQYELQLLKSAKLDELKGDQAPAEGLGKLAHDTWRTEEHIRALLLRDDGFALPVPDELHGKLWLLASGAATEMRRCKGQYGRFVAMEEVDTDATRQIDADLHRTVPDEDKPSWNEEKTKMMRRVLIAYSLYNPTLGYCQGLNYIVARLLQFVDEEEAFYLLIKMLGLVPDDYYTTMLGLAVDQHVFADLVRIQAPEIVKHLEELGGSGMELSLACTEWFLTLFSSPCSRSVTVRIWDLIFLIGDEILFRVGLSLLDLEKVALLKCNSYGDMLRSLNELGRREIDAAKLILDAQKKEVVSRLRIDDFRAHHRLQLATGIAVQSAEEASDPTKEVVPDTKEETKAKVFGQKKRQGLFKTEKGAGRAHRTFDRHLTDDYAESLQKEHPTFSCYYDGRPPLVFDQYWGSAASQTIWGRRNYRRITETLPVKEQKEERRRLQSDGSGLVKAQRIPDDGGAGARIRTGSGRERRSKSIGLIPPNKTGSNQNGQQQHQQPPQQIQQARRPVEDENNLSRSPKGWLQRIEGWHKDLKIMKEKKKAEKMKNKLGDSSSVPTRGGITNRDRGMNHTFAAPTWRHIEENEVRGNSFDGHHLGKKRVEKRNDSMDVNVSTRSHSDPFLSPNDPQRRSSFQDPTRQSMGEDMEAQIKMRSQESDKSDFAQSHGPTERRHSGGQRRGSMGSIGTEFGMVKAASAESKPRRRRSVSRPAPASTSALNSFDLDSTDHSRLSFDMGRLNRSGGPEFFSSSKRGSISKGSRAVSADLDEEKVRNDSYQPFGASTVRRNQSMPVEDGANLHLQQQQLHNQQQFYGRQTRKMTPETARVIRERAQVLSYMQRKVSDASSLSLAGSFGGSVAGSYPLTPAEKNDVLRISESSSDSSRYSEFMLPTTRSAKSVVQPANVRKSSFSFFDKLSSDLDDLHGSFMEDSDTRDSIDSAIFSRTWSPSSAHHKILGAMGTTD